MYHRLPAALGALALVLSHGAYSADQPQWGQRHSRSMVSPETGLPDRFDPETGAGVRWTVPLGNAYGSPTVANGRVFIGANNATPRDPRHQGDRGVLLCLNEADGALQWQLVVPRLSDDKYKDWPMIGMCSPPTIDGDRAYTVTNRFELVCLDIAGLANGNDGPYLDESRHMSPEGEPAMEPGPLDADILWLVDLQNDPAIGIHPHDSSYSSILIDGDLLYLNTGNGVDNTHAVIRRPDAPSLAVFRKDTGQLVARDGERMGPMTIHGTWSSPALGEVGGARRIFFGGGDGTLYSFDALSPTLAAPESPLTMKAVWRFVGDPGAPRENVHDYLNNREVSPSNIKGTPVYHAGRVYFTVGGDIWWGKEQSWLKCLKAEGAGDITESGVLWAYPMAHHSVCTPAIAEGLIFVADCAGLLHCLDVETGEALWTHELRKEIWGSPLVADGKVYVGSMGGDFVVLSAAREKKILSTVRLDGPISGTPVAANGVLYVNTLNTLFATTRAAAE